MRLYREDLCKIGHTAFGAPIEIDVDGGGTIESDIEYLHVVCDHPVEEILLREILALSHDYIMDSHDHGHGVCHVTSYVWIDYRNNFSDHVEQPTQSTEPKPF